MAVYFGRNEVIDPLVEASDIGDLAQTAFRLSGNTQANLPVNNARFLAVTFVESVAPTTSDPVGMYSVQTGAARGWYMNNGASIVFIPYPSDGTWPI